MKIAKLWMLKRDSSPGGNSSIVVPHAALPVFGISISSQTYEITT
jgi:hypothetical protein